MAEKIIILGTTGTREALTKNPKSGGLIIQAGNNQFLLDPGVGSTIAARDYAINLRETTSIIVTSNLLTSANDINAVIDTITHAGQDPQSVLLCADAVVNKTDKQEPTLRKNYMQYVERAIALQPNQKVGINDVEIHTLKTKNEEDPSSIGLKFYTPKYTIAYTGDTQYYEGIEEQYADAEVLIIKVQEPLGEISGKGMSMDDVVNIVKKIKPTLTILTGFGLKIIKADPVFQAREAQKRTQCQISAAKEGMVVGLTAIRPRAAIRGFDKRRKEETASKEPDIEEVTEEESDAAEEANEEAEEIKSINLDEEKTN